MASSAAKAPITAVRAAKRALRKSMAAQLAQMSRNEILEQSSAVTSKVLASPTYQNARSISIYVSMASGEVDTDELCRQTLALGKKLYVPLFAVNKDSNSSQTQDKPAPAVAVAVKEPPQPPPATTATMSKDMKMLRLRDLSEYEGMKENKWGIREPLDWVQEVGMSGQRKPREDALEESTGGDGLDLILAPGVAFDSLAGRLGHGKGYYDRYLSRSEGWAATRGRKGPVCVALGLTPQVLPPGETVPRDEFDRTLDGIITPTGILRSPEDHQRWADPV